MRVFEIYDTTKRGHSACAFLKYDEESEMVCIDISANASSEDLPFLLGMFVDRGEYHIDHDWAMRWVSERVPPSSRQNIGEILRANDLQDYDEISLLAANKGRSSQDDFMVREVSNQVDYAFVRLESGVGDDLAELKRAVGVKLAHARRQAGLTQGELAERTGIAQAVISRIERGQANPTLETLHVLSCGLGGELGVEIT